MIVCPNHASGTQPAPTRESDLHSRRMSRRSIGTSLGFAGCSFAKKPSRRRHKNRRNSTVPAIVRSDIDQRSATPRLATIDSNVNTVQNLYGHKKSYDNSQCIYCLIQCIVSIEATSLRRGASAKLENLVRTARTMDGNSHYSDTIRIAFFAQFEGRKIHAHKS